MSFDEAIQLASREERFMATVYAMNTLLIEKGVYSKAEFEARFVEWMKKEMRKNGTNQSTTSSASAVASR
ncbi:MAG TPA: hypothetical protein VJR23_15575 [Candidatus Acidoferrales bacterium]|nr:hypothetical protein [Candidatus Acidoferrales bacterium]